MIAVGLVLTTDCQRPTIDWMRLAWFSPLPPTRSGIAAYTAEVVPHLSPPHAIDCFDEAAAHDFVWQARRTPYDLVVYQLGNAPCHDYMWAYLVTYPGLVVLHDARLHHARARRLLNERRFDDYRREFAYDHPDARPDFAEYAVEGLGGSIYYFWSMLRVIMRASRTVAVHNPRVADDLRSEYPDVPIETIRMGVPPIDGSVPAYGRARRALAIPDAATVFAVFGKVTAEKRIASILRALAALVASGRDAYLLLVGDADEYGALAAELAQHGVNDRVRVSGHVSNEAVGAYLAAADACLCLRWPTAQETSASWLRCLAAGRATVISDLAHLVDIPASATVRIDLLDEDRELQAAMQRLVDDRDMRARIARAGHAHWAAHHTVNAMASDYERVIQATAARHAPRPTDLPTHFTEDYSELARRVADRFGRQIDILQTRSA
jgi:glycosyltransferase involved in cell wall biosynthesis